MKAPSEALVVVGDHEFDTMETALFQSHEEVPPTRLAFPAGEFDSQDLPISVGVDAYSDEDGLRADDHAPFPHPRS